jgi:hypothetical protein
MKFSKVLASVMAMLLICGPVFADNINWTIRSEHPNVVSLEFYSQEANRAWPGDGEVYMLDDSDNHSFNLQCSSGEQICYGAWVRGNSDTYWGVGLNNSNRCTDCCYTCGRGDTGLRILNN